MITPGQIYGHFDFRDRSWTRIRITAYTPGHARAHVEDADTGKRPRQILVAQLHNSPTTRDGQPRQTGYILETEPTP